MTQGQEPNVQSPGGQSPGGLTSDVQESEAQESEAQESGAQSAGDQSPVSSPFSRDSQLSLSNSESEDVFRPPNLLSPPPSKTQQFTLRRSGSSERVKHLPKTCDLTKETAYFDALLKEWEGVK